MSHYPNGLPWWGSILGALTFIAALGATIWGAFKLDEYFNPGDYE